MTQFSDKLLDWNSRNVSLSFIP